MIIHHISEEHITKLEEIFAVLTEDGWHIPCWINELWSKYYVT